MKKRLPSERRIGVVGYVGGKTVHSVGDPLPPLPGQLIQVEKGIRYILPCEWGRLKGLSKDEAHHLSGAGILKAVSANVWSSVILGLENLLTHPLPAAPLAQDFTPIPTDLDFDEAWRWTVPDLSPTSPWFCARVASLRAATNTMPDGAFWFKEGLQRITTQAGNFGPKGLQGLAILWWEWDEEHWEDLRLGVSLNFLTTPTPGIVPNGKMTPETRAIAKEFVDELVHLKVLVPKPPGMVVKNTLPLFILEKAGQPGEYRCIANAKEGGQNVACAADPIHLHSSEDILPHLYHGGYSAVVDFSKYFYTYRTREEERQYLGMIDPVTEEMRVYGGLPMGATNSPGGSGKHGAAFIRMVEASCPVYTGKPLINDPVSCLTGLPYKGKLGVGRVLIGKDGLPAVLVWLHCDDIFIHGPNFKKTQRGQAHLLDMALQVGLVAKPEKTKPPRQRQLYCGRIYDTQSTPASIIPMEKGTRAKALVDYIRDPSTKVSRAALAILLGTLESLVRDTPHRQGSGFVHHLYKDLHPEGFSPPDIKLGFNEVVTFSPESLAELLWWSRLLPDKLGYRIQPSDLATLCATWGDGSGTGTGGTVQFRDAQSTEAISPMEAFMGTWTLVVHSFSSNWKELRTLRVVLTKESSHTPNRYRHRLLFYFTDNMVTYDILRKRRSKSPLLHALIMEITGLEIQLDCCIVCVHVPGDVMITEGTDGLSRGVELTPLNLPPKDLYNQIFAPVPPSAPMLQWVLSKIQSSHLSSPWETVTDLANWEEMVRSKPRLMWFLSPQLARQAMTKALLNWTEHPFDHEHVFVIPRVLQRSFGRMNKHMIFLGIFKDYPRGTFPGLTPLCLFHLPTFTRSLTPPEDVDMSSPTYRPRWVQAQIKYMHGLQ